MTRYHPDPFTGLLQDSGSGPHDLNELGILFIKLLNKGMTRDDLIKLVLLSFKTYGLTAGEARKLVDQALGLDRDEPELGDDLEDGPSPF